MHVSGNCIHPLQNGICSKLWPGPKIEGAELFWEIFFLLTFFSMVSIENGKVLGGSGPVTLSTAKISCGLKGCHLKNLRAVLVDAQSLDFVSHVLWSS